MGLSELGRRLITEEEEPTSVVVKKKENPPSSASSSTPTKQNKNPSTDQAKKKVCLCQRSLVASEPSLHLRPPYLDE